MPARKKEISKKELMEKYSDYLLSNGNPPLNVYVFMKGLGFGEGVFYEHFASFEAIESEFLSYFFDESLKLIQKIDHFEELSSREKLLNFYFTFFENLNINRSLTLMILKEAPLKEIRKLKPLRIKFKTFVRELKLKDLSFAEHFPDGLKKYAAGSKEHVLWLHFLAILKFWKKDRSAGFEDTDIFIEKTVDSGFELADHSLLDKFMDLGKFLFEHRFH